MITTVASAIIAIAKIVPYISSLLSTITEQWQKMKIESINDDFEKKKARRDFATQQFKGAQTDEERKVAFRLLVSVDE